MGLITISFQPEDTGYTTQWSTTHTPRYECYAARNDGWYVYVSSGSGLSEETWILPTVYATLKYFDVHRPIVLEVGGTSENDVSFYYKQRDGNLHLIDSKTLSDPTYVECSDDLMVLHLLLFHFYLCMTQSTGTASVDFLKGTFPYEEIPNGGQSYMYTDWMYFATANY